MIIGSDFANRRTIDWRDGVRCPDVASQDVFFVRHPVFAFVVPFTAGFVAANLGRSGARIISLSVWAVLVVLAVEPTKCRDGNRSPTAIAR